MTAQTARLFFAFWPDAPVRARLADLAGSLAAGSAARAVPQENLHATIAFVGAVPIALFERVRAIGAAQRAAACSMRFEALEYWPKPEVVVAATRTVDPGLERLWQRLHRDLAGLQLALDAKRLRPHVTLATHVAQPPPPRTVPPFEWRARDFCLVRSETGGERSVYTVVDTWPLLDEAGDA
jgi:2'-5' RNA ligase